MKSNWFTIFVSFYCTAEWLIYMCVYMSVYLYICIDLHIHVYRLPRWPRVKNPPASAGGVGSIPGPGRSPGEGNGNPLQYCCLGNPMGRGAWWVYSSGGCKESDMTWLLNNSNSYVCVCVYIYIFRFFSIVCRLLQDIEYSSLLAYSLRARLWWLQMDSKGPRPHTHVYPRPCCLSILGVIHGVAKSRARLGDWTELNWTEECVSINPKLLVYANFL